MDKNNGRNLITAILAFQTGMIKRGQLLEAIRTWIKDKNRDLCDILVDQQAIDSDARDLLVAMVAKHEQMHGDEPRRSLEMLSSLHSSLTQSLQELADPDVESVIVETAKLHDQTQNLAEPATSRRTSPGDSKHGRFSVIRPHAKGGLGEVFVAFDHELNRQVALKEIQGKHSFDEASRTRFLQEAEITGGLEHPGIVPVYGLGTYGDGRPFYAMRFIKGMSLAQASNDFHATHSPPTSADYQAMEFRKLLQRLVDVCFSIEYAHSRGVLHRDLKPGNIMLGKYGETLVVDWGLAKAIGRHSGSSEFSDEETFRPSSGNDSTNTRLGQAVGTPAYMSPEAAAGNLLEIDIRSDVYCLGATLYHLLTGRPPYQRPELNDPEIIKAGKFPKPRELNQAIPKSLEAIALQAMQFCAADRYPSAKAVADDIELWLADEPIAAYPEPLAVRAARLVRRHKTLVASLAAITLLLLVGITGYSALLTGKNRDLQIANREIEKQRLRASENAKTARDVADSILEVSERQISNVQGAESFRLDLTERAHSLFEDAHKQEPNDKDVALKFAKSSRYLGNLLGKTKDRERGLRLLQKSLQVQLEAALNDQLGLDLLSGTYRDIGSFFKTDGKLSAASNAFLQADEVAAGLVRDFPDNPNNLRVIGPIAIERIALYMESLNYDAAIQTASKCEQIYIELAASDAPSDLDYAIAMLANSRHLQLLARLGRYDEARKVYDDGLARSKYWLERSDSVQVRGSYPRAMLYFADELSKQNTFPEDIDTIIDESIRLYEILIEKTKSSTHQYYLAGCYRVKATIDHARGKREGIDLVIAKSIDGFTALLKEQDRHSYRGALAEARYVNAQFLKARNDDAGYQQQLSEAVDQQRLCAAGSPESLYERQRLIDYEKELAILD